MSFGVNCHCNIVLLKKYGPKCQVLLWDIITWLNENYARGVCAAYMGCLEIKLVLGLDKLLRKGIDVNIHVTIQVNHGIR